MKENNINIEKLEELINLYVKEVGDDYFRILEMANEEFFLFFNYVRYQNKEDQIKKLRERIVTNNTYHLFKLADFFGISRLADYLHNLIVYKNDTKYLEQISEDISKENVEYILFSSSNTSVFENIFAIENEEKEYENINKGETVEIIKKNDKIKGIYNKFDYKGNYCLDKVISNLLFGDFVRWRENRNLKIKIENYFTIKSIELTNFNSNEIYLLGENGAGKSILLQNILFQLKGTNFFTTKKATDISEIINVFNSEKINYVNKIFSDVLAYGVNRNNLSRGLKESFEFMTLFSNEYKLRNPIDWFKNIYNQENEDKVNPIKAKNHIKLEDAKKMFSDLLDNNIEINPKATHVDFKETGGKPIDFNSLADGYKSVLTWVTDMISRFSETQPYVTELKDFKGTVLIDELDLFLHPKWAYKIMAKLRGWFPRVRFIISTHSPVLILGASKDAIIYKVSKNENGETEVSEPYEFKDYQHLTSNAFLTAPFMFDLEFSGTREMKGTDFYKNQLDTSDSYLQSLIYKKIKQVNKNREKEQLSENEINDIIDNAIKQLGGEDD